MMIDTYIDNVSLEKILNIKENKQMFIFKNIKKDEALALSVTKDELLNIFIQIKNHCETLDLIYPINFKGIEV